MQDLPWMICRRSLSVQRVEKYAPPSWGRDSMWRGKRRHSERTGRWHRHDIVRKSMVLLFVQIPRSMYVCMLLRCYTFVSFRFVSFCLASLILLYSMLFRLRRRIISFMLSGTNQSLAFSPINHCCCHQSTIADVINQPLLLLSINHCWSHQSTSADVFNQPLPAATNQPLPMSSVNHCCCHCSTIAHVIKRSPYQSTTAAIAAAIYTNSQQPQ